VDGVAGVRTMSREYPHSERDNNRWAGAIRVPVNANAQRFWCGLPSGQGWHRFVGRRCLTCGLQAIDDAAVAWHLTTEQFDRRRS
jgi:hypothetical protein